MVKDFTLFFISVGGHRQWCSIGATWHGFAPPPQRGDDLILVNINIYYIIMCTTGEKEYYEKQFATLKSFEEVDAIESCDGVDEDEFDEHVMQQERAMKVSNYANVLLLAFKVL
ncbi:hypothetical protein HanHA300_Chr13g0484011 [Helianthus annuus]|nr:hypothetical protein HanHA300_Chr13g0484011 [Helianthus annuus]KAJ0663874.1 hypothetical protein HanLR1_Chr13g0485881 [Helianthus annuus]